MSAVSPLTAEQIAAGLVLCERATGDVWEFYSGTVFAYPNDRPSEYRGRAIVSLGGMPSDLPGPQQRRDLDFIAAARAMLPAALVMAQRYLALRTGVEQLRTYLRGQLADTGRRASRRVRDTECEAEVLCDITRRLTALLTAAARD